MIDVIGKRRYGYVLSLVLVITGLLFILATLIPSGNVGLQFSIDYAGGTEWEIRFEGDAPDPRDIRAILDEQGLTGSQVAITSTDDREFVRIRTEALSLQETTPADGSAAAALAAQEAPAAGSSASAEASETPMASPAPDASPVASPDASPVAVGAAADDPAAPVDVPTEGAFGELATALQEAFGPIVEVRQEKSVGPVVSAELIQQTFLLIVIASIAIMGWVSFRFRDVRMGVTAVTALVHDVIITVGAFAILGTFTDLQVDALFVTAMLTVIGFSVHDTIVVFDRIRENRHRYIGEPLEDVVNHSLVQTLGRSVTTSLTLVVTLVALLLFGGEAIRPFTLALLIGVVAGTYSSIFVATPLFLDWHLFDARRRAGQPVEVDATASTA